MPSLTKVQTGFLEPQGAFTLESGTASAPGLKFSTSAATGMFSPSTGALAFSTGSTQNALTILSGGNVGIGTTNPDNKFEVHDRTTSLTSTPVVTSRIMRADGTYNPRIDIRHSTTGTDINHTYSTSAECMTISIGNVERIRINGNGNVGIGITNPNQKLVVDGVVTASNFISSSYSVFSSIVANDPGANYYSWNNRIGGGLAVAGTTYLDGNVGIGTTNPIRKLSIYDSTPSAAAITDFILWSDGTRTSTLNQTGSSYSYAGVGSNEMWYYSNSSYSAITLGSDGAIPIKFVSGGGERLRITSSGNVGIGTTNPSNLLTLGASGGPTMRLTDTSSGVFSILSSSSNGSITFSADHGNTGSATNIIFSSDGNQERLRIDSVGNTSIGGFAPSPDDLGGKNLEIGFVGNLIKGYQTGNLIMTNNAYYQGGWKYANTGKSISYYQMNGNEQIWMNSPSGTAGNAVTFTERARLNSGGFASDFILLSSDNNHQIRSYVDAQKYFDVQGGLNRASYNGTSIGLASRPGYGVDLILYLGGKQPLLPSGWTGTVSCVGNANAGSLGTTVYLQTSTDGITWTTRAQTANTWNVTLSWTQSTAENVPIFVRFRLLQSSGGNVGEGSCRISDIRITNLFAKPFAFTLANKLISQYSYQNTTVSSDLIDYQISLLGGTGAYASNNIGHGIAFYCPGVSTDSTGSVVAAINSIDEGAQDAQGLSFCTANSTIGSLSEKLRISNSGNVGIGTTNPQVKLDVHGDIYVDSSGGITDRYIYFRNQSTEASIRSDKDLSLWTGNGGGTPTKYLTIAQGGNVGIGITNPASKLSIVGNLALSDNSISERTQFSTSAGGFILNHNDNSAIYIKNNGVERLRVSDVGHLIIQSHPYDSNSWNQTNTTFISYQKYVGDNQSSWYYLKTGAPSYSRAMSFRLRVNWTTGHASGVGYHESHVVLQNSHATTKTFVAEFGRLRENYWNGSFYNWTSAPTVYIYNSDNTDVDAGVWIRIDGHMSGYDGYAVQHIFMELYGNHMIVVPTFQFISNSTPANVGTQVTPIQL